MYFESILSILFISLILLAWIFHAFHVLSIYDNLAIIIFLTDLGISLLPLLCSQIVAFNLSTSISYLVGVFMVDFWSQYMYYNHFESTQTESPSSTRSLKTPYTVRCLIGYYMHSLKHLHCSIIVYLAFDIFRSRGSQRGVRWFEELKYHFKEKPNSWQ